MIKAWTSVLGMCEITADPWMTLQVAGQRGNLNEAQPNESG
jgi:hypothetical protein